MKYDMKNKEENDNYINIEFDIYEMKYNGGLRDSTLPVISFDKKYYDRYKELIHSCYYEMREALNIKPYKGYCESLEELMVEKDTIFLLMNDDEIICTASCEDNEVSNVAVNLKYQNLGYGRKILNYVISFLQKQGHSTIRLTVLKWNKKAIALYNSVGFEITNETTVTGINSKNENGNWSFKFTSTGEYNIR